jgi:hypothetical protein
VSDEQRDQRERAEDQAPEEDVEAHGFSAPNDAPIGATEEPPDADVEAHGFSAPHEADAPIGATEEPPDVEGHNMGAPNTRPIQ